MPWCASQLSTLRKIMIVISLGELCQSLRQWLPWHCRNAADCCMLQIQLLWRNALDHVPWGKVEEEDSLKKGGRNSQRPTNLCRFWRGRKPQSNWRNLRVRLILIETQSVCNDWGGARPNWLTLRLAWLTIIYMAHDGFQVHAVSRDSCGQLPIHCTCFFKSLIMSDADLLLDHLEFFILCLAINSQTTKQKFTKQGNSYQSGVKNVSQTYLGRTFNSSFNSFINILTIPHCTLW